MAIMLDLAHLMEWFVAFLAVLKVTNRFENRFYGFLFQQIFLDFWIKPRSWLISYFFNSLWSLVFEDIKTVVFPNAPCLINVHQIWIKLQHEKRNAFALSFLKFRVSTYLGLCLWIPILQMAKVRLWSLIHCR